MSQEPGFFEAWDATVTPLVQARKLLSLVAGASTGGLLDQLYDGLPAAEIAARTDITPEVADALLAALVANGVASLDSGMVRLRPAWRAVAGPTAYTDLAGALRGAEIEARALASIATGEDYWTMSSQDRLDYARSVSPDPFRPEFVAAVRASATASPVRSRLEQGGRLLEAGCGVAGQLLSLIQAFPRLEAVGVELADDLADEAERRAGELGVADRFTVVRGDVAEVALEEETFDFAHWSQFFFPTPARLPALRAVHRALRPGGFVYAPLPFPFETMAAEPEGADAQDYTLFRVILSSWGIPERDESGLAAEMVDAGFVNPHLVRAPGDVPRMVADRS